MGVMLYGAVIGQHEVAGNYRLLCLIRFSNGKTPFLADGLVLFVRETESELGGLRASERASG